jgi:hypothetical protein
LRKKFKLKAAIGIAFVCREVDKKKKSTDTYFFPLWLFDLIPGHDLALKGFAITHFHTTLGRTPLDE